MMELLIIHVDGNFLLVGELCAAKIHEMTSFCSPKRVSGIYQRGCCANIGSTTVIRVVPSSALMIPNLNLLRLGGDFFGEYLRGS